ncbi:hypothetical protein [Pseudorhodoplanes sinuspersici]|uniref:Antitoxin-like ribbon-helix-helix domain-containing protein n=1 Tax=Pseudorhodoplanes sinuspersici TaxID=1235591 RepID=A0A1W6ZV00_9HYPH|nr:hypothetical protein [Pseudorhodoplanes sinuspersici]ARQ01269.1 hypothetical protein CAK95_20845 [Pseudorhodoplanes sinuspersici]RKE72946.1 hypothetical protein DFP91_0819 [Pseudorhodoplanes sinuspersici]
MPRKLIDFHTEDLRALQELAEDRSSTLQELVDEAVRDVLRKHGKFTDLRAALTHSSRDDEKAAAKPRPAERRKRSRR